MIAQINIKKYLYLEDISIDFSDGLNIFTGETGVGKSLIIDAVDFVLGKKGNFENGTGVEVVFEGVNNPFSEDGTLILLREIKGGKSLYFINGRRATLSSVKEASKGIIEIHGQHHQQKLFNQDFHRVILDRFANLNPLIEQYQKYYSAYKQLEKKEKELIEQQSNRLRELDILKFQLKEIEEANIKEGEKEELEKRYRYLSEIQNIKEVVYTCSAFLSEEENSIVDKLSFVLKSIEKVKDTSPVLEEVYNTLQEADILIKEADYSLQSLDLDFDPYELKDIENRLNLINKLEMKYNTDEKGLIKLSEEFKEKINFLENLEFELPKLQKEKEKVLRKIKELSEKISKIRKEKAKELDRLMEKHLSELGFKEAKFITEIEERDLDRYGKDRVKFLFSANKGFNPSPLENTASGGEISRISLALKVITGSEVDCMVFDEIDTGIGGKTALFMAEKLKKLSEKYQIILITHLPQIAIFADKHFYIEKVYSGEKTKANIKVLGKKERKKEIARMLTGEINQKSLSLAESLLQKNKS
ncbi:MAG: DNA repair protein RecN [Aquificota bacterium]|nr:MAG: DNA repair protein RecN [Aquificota bacterium]